MRKTISFRSFNYIFNAVFWPFLFSLIAFFSLIFVMQFINNSELLLLDSKELKLSFKFFAYGSLSYVPLITPFCLLFGILFGYGKLSSDHELTAFSNMGYSKWHLAQPAIVLSIVVFIVCSTSVHNWGPQAKSKSKFLNSLITEKLALSAIQQGVFLDHFPGVVFYTEELNKKNSELRKVFLLHSKKNNNKDSTKFIFSDSGTFKTSKEAEGFKLNLVSGNLYATDTDKRRDLKVKFNSYTASMFQGSDFKFNSNKPEFLTTDQINTKIKLEKSGSFIYKLEKHKRYALSLTCIFFTIVPLLLSLKLHNRSSSGKGFLLALGLSLTFWILLFTGEFLAQSLTTIIFIYTPLAVFVVVIAFISYWNRLRSII